MHSGKKKLFSVVGEFELTMLFSALAALEGAEMPTSPPSNPASPATTKADVARERSRSPEKTT